MPTASGRAEVWGSPIEHSLSPSLHRAAYAALGMDWSYDRRDVTTETFARHWELRSGELTGLSATMPLKESLAALPLERDHVVDALGVGNTLYRAGGKWRCANTDPWGVVGALSEAGVETADAVIVGAGATARAVCYGLQLAGVRNIDFVVRNPARATETARIAQSLGLNAQVLNSFEEVSRAVGLVVSTLPGGSSTDLAPTESVIDSSRLFDVGYSPWPTPMAAEWFSRGQGVISGLSMLIHQAIRQIRFFAQGSDEEELPHEAQALRAMRDAVALEPGSGTAAAVGE